MAINAMIGSGVQGAVSLLLLVSLVSCAPSEPHGGSARQGEPGVCESSTPWPDAPVTVDAGPGATANAALAAAWTDGPNFACTALLVTWGCGSGCVSGGVYDAQSDVWQSFPFAIHRHPGQEEPVLDYQESSRHLRARGWLNEVERGVFLYAWDGSGLVRIEQ